MKESSLSPLRTFKFAKNDTFTLAELQELLTINFNEAGCNVSFSHDVVKTDGLFKSNPDCLVVTNNEHTSDYFNFVFYQEDSKKENILYVKVGGKSKQAKYDIFSKQVKVLNGGTKRALVGGMKIGGVDGVAYAVGGLAGAALGAGVRAIGKGINSLLRDEEAYKAEVGYYDKVIAAIDYSLMAK